jgi:hypothetical protein
MRPKLAIAIALVVVMVGFTYLAPIIYVPAVPPSHCNGFCMLGGHGAYYVSLPYQKIGQCAWYWVGNPGTYELINTPFGSFG